MNFFFKLLSKLLYHIIDTYKVMISPYLGHHCRFHPSCSSYAKESLMKDHFFISVFKITWRLLCCWPPGDYLIALEKKFLKWKNNKSTNV